MKHALIDSASKTELAAAIEAADWLLDAVACSTQDIDDLLAHWNIPTRAKAGLK